MIALHLSFYNGKFLLWSESGEIGSKKDLRKAVKQFDIGKSSKINSTKYQFWLPGKRGKKTEALPSHPLVGKKPSGNYKVRLIPFTGEALSLDFTELTDLLIAAAGNMEQDSEIIFGNSIRWAANLFEVGVNMIIKELFVPTLEKRDDGYYATWKPVPDKTEDMHIKRLLNEMPAVLRCCNSDKDTPPAIPGELVIVQILDKITDNIIRRNKMISRLSIDRESVHDDWLISLTSEDGKMQWDNEEEVTTFARQLSGWSRQVFVVSKSPLNVCFKLVEPAQENDDWSLEYMLQSKSDPGLIVPFSLIWSKKKKDAETLKRIGFESLEMPLTLLGQAAGLYPLFQDNLNSKRISHLTLDARQALTFMQDYADILSRMGFSILLPSWWKGRNTESRLSMELEVKSPKMQSRGEMGLDSILKFNYRASLGQEKMTLKELNALAKIKAPLVKIRGEWTYIDPVQIQECINFLKKQKEEDFTVKDFVHTSLGNKPLPVPVEAINADGWARKLLDGLTEKKGLSRLKQPESFSGTLRHYQTRGYSWLYFLKKWGFGACLADDMGLGKTIQTLALIQYEAGKGEKRPVLLVCPTTVVNNWYKEAEKFTPNLAALVHHGSDRQKDKSFVKQIKNKALIITSFGLVYRDLETLKKIDWAGIVVDEAQNIKNYQTKSSKAVRSLKADYRIALTGTPVENHVGDLWSIMEFLNPGMLGSIKKFKENFHKPITIYQDDHAAAKLNKIVSPFILRRYKTDKSIIKDLPDKIESKEYCTLTKEQVSLYKAVADDVQEQVEGTEGIDRKGAVLAALTKLKQVCNHPAQFHKDNSELFGRSGKLQRTMELLSEIFENGERTLIFTQYFEMGSILQKVLQQHFGREVFFIHGKVSKKKRDEMIERFQNSDNAPYFFILSLKAGGTGITLTRANNVIHYDRWWNPAVEQQATDRAFRIGQHHNVQVHKLLVTGTLEEKIDQLIMNKQQVADKVVSSGEAWLSELSDTDFNNLISLSGTAQGD